MDHGRVFDLIHDDGRGNLIREIAVPGHVDPAATLGEPRPSLSDRWRCVPWCRAIRIALVRPVTPRREIGVPSGEVVERHLPVLFGDRPLLEGWEPRHERLAKFAD